MCYNVNSKWISMSFKSIFWLFDSEIRNPQIIFVKICNIRYLVKEWKQKEKSHVFRHFIFLPCKNAVS